MITRYTFIGLLAAMTIGPMAGQARAADGFQMLDLKPIVNMDWRDEVWGDGKGGWTDQGDNDMRQISVGTRQLLGIPFELIDPAHNGGKAVLTLGSKKFPAGPLAATARFGGKARSLYFLHAAAWSGGHMATYVVHYADGATAEIPIRDKEEIMNWWWPTHGPKYRAAIHVPNAQTDDVGLVVFGWDNPQADKVIRDIELKSLNADGIVVVAAITASDKPVRLPDPKDIPAPEYLQSDLPTLDQSQWFPVEVVEDKFQPTPIDQSAALDAPAGKHGFMKTVDGRWVFEDGAPVRLVATMQGTPRDKKESAYMARWLAKYGFNLVRIGHLVTGPEQGSAVDWSQPDSGHLNAGGDGPVGLFHRRAGQARDLQPPHDALVPQAEEGRRRGRLRRVGGLCRQEGQSPAPARRSAGAGFGGHYLLRRQGDAGQHRPGKGHHDPSQSVPGQQDVWRGPGRRPDRSDQ